MRTRRRISALLSLTAAAALACPAPAGAWGPDGHDYIASVARDLLRARDPALEARFQAILRGNVLHFVGTSTRTGRPTACNGNDLRQIASWPDCIRYTTQRAGTAGYHFDDVRLCDSVPPPPPPPAHASQCDEGKCASEGLRHFISILSNHHRSRHERAEALAWVIHIVGDLHQPLHNETNQDRGGNDVHVGIAAHTFERNFSARKLHAIWDTPMVYAAVGEGQQAVAAIRAVADSHASDPAWAGPDVHDWVVRAHTMAQDAYRTLNPAPACDAGETSARPVTMTYFDPFKDDVADQLAKAAIRLADILEDALA